MRIATSLVYDLPEEVQQPEQPSVWGKAGDYAMEALGGAQALGNVASGMLAWPVGKAAGGLVGPFVEGGPDMVEGFVGDMMQTKPPAEGTRARAGYDVIEQPVGKAMDVMFAPAKKVKDFVKQSTGSDGAAWSAGLLAELATFKGMHVAGVKMTGPMKAKQLKARKAAENLAMFERKMSQQQEVKWEPDMYDFGPEAPVSKQAQAMLKDLTSEQKVNVDKQLNLMADFAKDIVADLPVEKRAEVQKAIDFASTTVSGGQGKAQGVDPIARAALMKKIKPVKREVPALGEQIQGGTPFEQVPKRVEQPGVEQAANEAVRLQEFERTGRSGGSGDMAGQPTLRSKIEQSPIGELGDISFGEEPTPLLDQAAIEERASRATVAEPVLAGSEYLSSVESRLREAARGKDLGKIRENVDSLYQEVASMASRPESAADYAQAMDVINSTRDQVIAAQRAERISSMPADGEVKMKQYSASELRELIRDKENQQRLEAIARGEEYKKPKVKKMSYQKKQSKVEAVDRSEIDTQYDIEFLQSILGGINGIGDPMSALVGRLGNIRGLKVYNILTRELYKSKSGEYPRARQAAAIIAEVNAGKSVKSSERMSKLKAAAERMKQRLKDESGSVDARTMSKETREAFEQTIARLRKEGMKFDRFLERNGMDAKTLLPVMNQIAKEMDRERDINKKAGSKLVTDNMEVRRDLGQRYKDQKTGELKKLYAPGTTRTQERLVQGIEEPVNRWGTGTSVHTFDTVEPQAKELFYYPHRENQGNTSRANTRTSRELKDMQKGLSRKDLRDINTEVFFKQRGGEKILKDAGWEVPTANIETRNPKAAPVYHKLMEFYARYPESVNVVREKIGRKPMNITANYATWLSDMFAEGKNPLLMSVEEVNKMQDAYVRASEVQSAKSRSRSKTLERQLEMNAFRAADRYARNMNKFINEAEHLTRMTELLSNWKSPIKTPRIDSATGEQKISKKTGELQWNEETSLQVTNPSAFKFLDDWKTYQMGIKVHSEIPVNLQKAFREASKNIVVSLMSYVVTSALNQASALVQAGTVLNHHLAGGMIDVINSAMPGSKLHKFMMDNSAHMPQRFGSFDVSVGNQMHGGQSWRGKSKVQKAWRGYTKVRDPIAKTGMMPVSAIDFVTASATWYGGYRQGMKRFKGDQKKAFRYADDVVVETQGSATTADRAPIQRSDLGALVTTLQTFALGNWDFMARDIFGWKNPSLKTSTRVARMTKVLVGMTALGYVFENLIGINSPMPNVVGTLMKGIKDDEDLDVLARNIALEIVEVIPGLGSIVKFQSALGGPLVDVVTEALTSKKWGTLIWKLSQLAGMPMGQVKKSYRQATGRAITSDISHMLGDTGRIRQQAQGSTLDIITGGRYDPKAKSSRSRGGRVGRVGR